MIDSIPFPTQFRAPAVLDVMGGISSCTGGIGLSCPLEIATDCRIAPRDDARICARFNESEIVEIARTDADWARHISEILDALRQQTGWKIARGINIKIDSTIVRDAGLSAAVSMEVAVLSALNRAFELSLNQTQIASLCSHTATALAIVLARPNHLSQIKCQPALVEKFIELPDGLELWALDSGVSQRAGDDAYNIALCAMQMGATLLQQLVPAAMRGPDGELYLANVGTDVWRALRLQIPEKLSGADFTKHHDKCDNLESERIYAVRLATEHPIYEADRARRFAQLLGAITDNPAARLELGRAAGELMIQSHFSYDHRCNLNGAETDLLVELARQIGPKRGIYGAKLTGRGAGGCVALLCDRQINADLEGTMEEICAHYAQQCSYVARVYRGT